MIEITETTLICMWAVSVLTCLGFGVYWGYYLALKAGGKEMIMMAKTPKPKTIRLNHDCCYCDTPIYIEQNTGKDDDGFWHTDCKLKRAKLQTLKDVLNKWNKRNYALDAYKYLEAEIKRLEVKNDN